MTKATKARLLHYDDAEIFSDRNDMFVTAERLTTVISCHTCQKSYENDISRILKFSR